MKKPDKKALGLMGIVVLGCLVMALTDAVLRPGYGIKSVIKLVFFLVLPLFFCRKTQAAELKQMLVLNKRQFLLSLIPGLILYGGILGAYFLVRNFYDFSGITGLLGENAGVTGGNFLLVAIYISFCNSFLEELFFRGFAFLGLAKYVGRKFAHGFSAFSFAAYHVAMMIGWFSPVLFLLALTGLAVGGYIFNRLDEKNGTIYNSWMVHMFANFAINTVGFILFGLL